MTRKLNYVRNAHVAFHLSPISVSAVINNKKKTNIVYNFFLRDKQFYCIRDLLSMIDKVDVWRIERCDLTNISIIEFRSRKGDRSPMHNASERFTIARASNKSTKRRANSPAGSAWLNDLACLSRSTKFNLIYRWLSHSISSWRIRSPWLNLWKERTFRQIIKQQILKYKVYSIFRI